MTLMMIILLVIVVLVLGLIFSYNSLVGTKNSADNAWSQVDVQLKRRHDLIPNLIETAKGYMTHERQTLESVTNARASALQADSLAAKTVAESALGSALGKFMMVAENYPDLKANQNFLAIQEELASTENKIAFARQAYNDAVMFYNNKLQMFPSNIIAGMFTFPSRQYLEIENKEEREVPKVSFGN